MTNNIAPFASGGNIPAATYQSPSALHRFLRFMNSPLKSHAWMQTLIIVMMIIVVLATVLVPIGEAVSRSTPSDILKVMNASYAKLSDDTPAQFKADVAALPKSPIEIFGGSYTVTNAVKAWSVGDDAGTDKITQGTGSPDAFQITYRAGPALYSCSTITKSCLANLESTGKGYTKIHVVKWKLPAVSVK